MAGMEYGADEVFAAMVMASGFLSEEQRLETVHKATSESEREEEWSGADYSVSSSAMSTPAGSPQLGERDKMLMRAAGVLAMTDKHAARQSAIQRYRLKKASRSFKKKIRYESRRALASSRARVGGRFVKRSDSEMESS
ncbi:Zinc finger protein HD1 [Porphyridium purpureum]|uniref:Zinc finger protein HD1 n=1 Tax=Porphyridium purpureum TaxID=35688 RepID=A0A5J4Z7N7_PORPP|nr:Zinc finger protein HD1 [Porphyridium purpureum]|eukprot:POR4197..scf295_1